jgi:hypothetical protein
MIPIRIISENYSVYGQKSRVRLPHIQQSDKKRKNKEEKFMHNENIFNP